MDRINPAALDATLSLAAFDMNVGTGGAAVYLWVSFFFLDTEAAVTWPIRKMLIYSGGAAVYLWVRLLTLRLLTLRLCHVCDTQDANILVY